MVATYPSTCDNVDTTAQAGVLDASDSTYSLLYFETQQNILNHPIRNLLALGDAIWTQLYPQDWRNEDQLDKSSTPFEVMPVLYVHSKDGSQTVAIAESKAIELYLAKKFNFLGRNSYEQALITSFVSSTASLLDDLLYSAVSIQASKEVMKEQIRLLLTQKIPKWMRIHEEHLKANGYNGHYIGDTLSLADLRAAAMIDIIQRFASSAQFLTQEIAPGLFKVKAMIDQHPKIVQWRETEIHRSLRPSDRQGNMTGGQIA
ncbi:hypothetical protein BGZ72_007974 [Mortierella alpina]|nr:hypothetical protein BGZ72_007974 [Mortierella alpina]